MLLHILNRTVQATSVVRTVHGHNDVLRRRGIVIQDLVMTYFLLDMLSYILAQLSA